MNTKHQKQTIILASQSPRRRQLLEEAGLSFDVIPGDVDEQAVPKTDPETFVKTLAAAKALDVAEKHPERWVIGADTIVVVDEKILEKPESREDACSMMRSLSGKTHHVYTGFSICCKEKHLQVTSAVKTEVVFKKLSENEILWYTSTEEPYDKAGGYAIQGLGSFMVQRINGSYSNVVGLPVCEVLDNLKKLRIYDLKPGQKGFVYNQ